MISKIGNRWKGYQKSCNGRTMLWFTNRWQQLGQGQSIGFRECGLEGICSSTDNIVSAHVVSSDNAHSAIRVVMSNQFIVGEILTVARELKASAFSSVYLLKDRTREEQECTKSVLTNWRRSYTIYQALLHVDFCHKWHYNIWSRQVKMLKITSASVNNNNNNTRY